MFGDAREMELHYFLADDTVEIVERTPSNSGRDAVPMFLTRQTLPKVSCVFVSQTKVKTVLQLHEYIVFRKVNVLYIVLCVF